MIPSSALPTGKGKSNPKQFIKRALRESALIGAQIRARFLAAFARGEQINLQEMFVEGMLPLLTKVMVITHDRGWNRQTQFYPKKVQLKLDLFDDAIAQIRDLEDSEYVAQLSRKYRTQALRSLFVAGGQLEQRARTAVNDAIAANLPTQRATEVLKTRFDALGITRSPHQLETIYRTQSSIAFNAGRWEADQQPEVQEILWGYEYTAVGDDRTREEHIGLNGTVLPKEDIFWRRFWPPNGWNCRCTTIPLFREETIVRAPTTVEVDGKQVPVEPDKGFAINFGHVFQTTH